MNKESIWQILGISETKNQDLIKEAYRNKLTHTNPEDDAQGFINLRNAYETALRLSSEPEADQEEEVPKSDIDLWIEQADYIYQDIHKRLDLKLWEELLENDVCTGLDTWLIAREKLLAYLMEHFYLPPEVWTLLDRKLDLVKDEENLLQVFPENFIEYVIRQIQNYSQIDFNLFTIKGNDSLDDYIRSYYNIKNLIDENQTDNLAKELDKLDGLSIYHPYLDTEKLRYSIASDNKREIEELIEKLSSYLEDAYIAYYVGKGYFNVNRHDEAAILWENICQKYPNHYSAQFALIEYAIHKGRYKEANERAVNLSKTYTRSEEIHNLLVEANEHLIKEYEEICQREPHNLQVREELAWCYYQNSYLEQCLQLLGEFPEETRKELWYLKIHGYAYAKNNEFRKALRYLFQWLKLLKSSEDEEAKQNLYICNQMIGVCYSNDESYEKAIPYFKQAILLEENLGDKLNSMERLAFALLKADKNEECIDVCDRIIKESKGYYPAYLSRQEAYYNMRNSQGVIDDYYKAIEIYPYYVKPYLLAAKVFYFHEQYEDSMGVITRAKEAKISSNELEFLYGKNLRMMAKNKEDREAALKVLLDLSERMKASQNNSDDSEKDEFDNLGEVLYELAKAYAGNDDFQTGLAAIEEAIEFNSEEDDYHSTKAYLYMDLERYEDAAVIMERLVKTYPQWEYIHVCLARCYEKLDREDEALQLYKKTLEINPDNVEATEKAGDIYINLYRREENIKYYKMAMSYGERLLELRQNCYYYVHVGIMYERGCEFEKSMECYQKAAECDPEDMWPHNNLGYILKILKRYEESIQEYQKAIELMEPGQAMQPHSNLATCFEILGRYEEALECYQEVLKHWPDNRYILEDVASVLVKMGKYKEAADVYLDMIKKNEYPKEEAYYNIMEIYAEAGDVQKATRYASKAIMTEETEIVLRRVGMYYFSIGKFGRAKNFLTRAIKMIESKKTLQYSLYALNLAELYFDEGNAEKARSWASEALSAIKYACGSEEEYVSYKPSSVIRNYRLGMIAMILGDHAKAEYHFKEAVQNLPCNTCGTKVCFEGHYGLGRLYEEMKDFDQAEEHYQKALEADNSPQYKRRLQEIENKKNNIKETFFKKIWRYL